MPSSLFYNTLTEKERAWCSKMPSMFKEMAPCERGFREAFAFLKTVVDPGQRGVAKRWINEHLRDLEYALKPLEWDHYPLSGAYYIEKGVDLREAQTVDHLRIKRWASLVKDLVKAADEDDDAVVYLPDVATM